ncbi:uncharacterized protein LOC108477895 [Gossypium arboreum]|uniref:uncharacterized protein LOC108477895 n=1 Tax=Gossypium arboreum TaxID=29729 RepID=UPI00081979D5|nr:uncharacterized protein LOC108477895 [Gossypium arboreum]
MKAIELSFVYYGEDYVFDECPSNPVSVYYMVNFNWDNKPYSNTYNLWWKQHLNFSWNNQGVGNLNNFVRQNANSASPGYIHPMRRAFENQVGQIANVLNSRPQGALPSDTENSRTQGNEQCKAITLRSGKHLYDVVQDTIIEENNFRLNYRKNSESTKKHITPEKGKQENVAVESTHFKRFLEVLKKLYINLQLIEALEQMPNYVKFMKYILSKIHRLGEFDTVSLIEGNECKSNAYVYFQKVGKARPITVTLQLADRSYAHPEDFLILECEADQDVPIILGRPFLTTSKTLIDITFNAFGALKCTDENEECHTIGLIETTLEVEFEKFCYRNSDSDKDSLERSDAIIFEDLGELTEAKQFVDRLRKKFESLDLSDRSFKPPKPSIEESPTL